MIKYYYSKPIEFFTCVHNSVLEKVIVGKRVLGKRYTFAAFYDDDSKSIKFGKSVCSPNDNFCKKTGREIAAMNAKNNPFYVIENFNGIRNDYADEVMEIFIETEKELLKKEYPFMFNQENFV